MIAALNGSSESLTIVLAGAKTTVDANYSLLYDGDNPSPSNPVGNTSGTTAVTMLAGVLNAVRTIRAMHLFNADSAAITATIKKVVSGTGYTRLTVTLQVGDTLVWDANGLRVIDSSGQLRSAASSYTTSVIAFAGATGENEIRIPTNLADALSLESSAGDVLYVDTTTGTVVFNFGAAVRVNVLGDFQGGNATTDLVAFHGSTPTDQCAAYTQTFSTADRTHAARTAAALTDDGGGAAADGTIGAITLTEPANLAAQTVINNQLADAVKELSTKINQVIVDLADTAGVVNAIVDDLQEKGLAG